MITKEVKRRERERERKEEWEIVGERERKKYFVWFTCLMAYQLYKGYLMPKFDSLQNVWLQKRLRRDRDRERGRDKKDEQWDIEEEREKDLFWFICLMSYQLLMGYLMQKFDWFVNVWLLS